MANILTLFTTEMGDPRSNENNEDEVLTLFELIFQVCMTTETAASSCLGTLMEKDPMLRQMPNVALALHLLLEKSSPCSFWEPYINLLPRYQWNVSLKLCKRIQILKTIFGNQKYLPSSTNYNKNAKKIIHLGEVKNYFITNVMCIL